MKKGIGINTIIFLSFGLITLVAWIGFGLYHKSNDLDISPKLTEEANTPLPQSFDVETLRTLYKGQDKFYEYKETTTE